MGRGRFEKVADVMFRTLFSSIFVAAGLKHLIRPEEIVERLVSMPLSDLATAVAPAPLLVGVTGVVLVLAGCGLFMGVYIRLAALALIVVLVPITITVDLGHTQNLGPLFKNIALLGGLVHFAAKSDASAAPENHYANNHITCAEEEG